MTTQDSQGATTFCLQTILMESLVRSAATYVEPIHATPCPLPRLSPCNCRSAIASFVADESMLKMLQRRKVKDRKSDYASSHSMLTSGASSSSSRKPGLTVPRSMDWMGTAIRLSVTSGATHDLRFKQTPRISDWAGSIVS